MYSTKQRIYNYFDKTQKSMLCTFLRSYCKCQNKEENNITPDEVLENFIDEQDYYLKIHSSRFPFIETYLTDDTFLSETKEYIKACLKYYNYKTSQAPLIKKQKEYEKKKRQFLQEIKMSKEKPTKKQLYYYERLCKKYNIDKKNLEELSKLDIRNEIERILNEYSRNSVDIGISRD